MSAGLYYGGWDDHCMRLGPPDFQGRCPLCNKVFDVEDNKDRTHQADDEVEFGFVMAHHYIANTNIECDGVGIAPTKLVGGVMDEFEYDDEPIDPADFRDTDTGDPDETDEPELSCNED